MVGLKSTYPIAIDIGEEHVYAVQLKEDRKGLWVMGLAQERISEAGEDGPDDNAALAKVLRKIAKNNQFSGKKVALHLPRKNVFSFPVGFKVESGETVEQAIVKESREYLSFPIEEAVIDYASIDPVSSGDSDEYKATIVAVRRDLLMEVILLVKKAGLDLEIVDFPVSSLIRMHDYLFNVGTTPVILCHIGHTRSLLSVVTKDRILADRNISWGTEALLKKIAANFELPNGEDKAMTFLRKYGLAHEDRSDTNTDGEEPDKTTPMDNMHRAIYQVITPYTEQLIDELHKMLGYLRSEEMNPVFEGIHVYGQGTLIHYLDGYIETRLNIPTRMINAMEKFTSPDSSFLPCISEGAPYAPALGLAMRKVTWL